MKVKINSAILIMSAFTILAFTVSVLTLSGCHSSAVKPSAAQSNNQHAVADLTPIKSLAGDWYGTNSGPHAKGKVKVTYRVTSGGSAVVETLMPGTKDEMVSVYHLEDGKLVMTHYCTLGNQPTLSSLPQLRPDRLNFEMSQASNLPNLNALHMGSLQLDMPSKNHLIQNWTGYENGKPLAPTVFDLHRSTKAAKAG